MWMTFDHLKTNSTTLAHYRIKIRKVIELFEFQSLTQQPLWAEKGRLFSQKVVVFPSFSSVMIIFYPTNRTNFVHRCSSSKNSKSLKLEFAKVLKLTLFSVRSLKSLTPAFPQIFQVTPIFVSRFWQQVLWEA